MKKKKLIPGSTDRRMCGWTECRESGVSEVVGEMLMIVLVIILLSVFSAAIYNYLPPDRDPTISIFLEINDRQNLTFWHKGGDWVKVEDLRVIISNETNRTSFSHSALILFPNKTVFDLGSNITVRTRHSFEGNETVRLVTSRAVIYTGRISL